MYKIKRYFQGVWKQGEMVRWPKKKDLMSAAMVVIFVVVFAAVWMMIDDFVISKLLQSLDQSFPTGGTDSSTSEGIEESIALVTRLFK